VIVPRFVKDGENVCEETIEKGTLSLRWFKPYDIEQGIRNEPRHKKIEGVRG
jgi:hypothetical protein